MGMEGFSAIFSALKDPRTGNARRHDLGELLMIALGSCLCGGTTCTEMAEFAEDKEPFLREFLDLENGLPSHDTFSRLFRLLDPVAFGECFSQFMQEFSRQTSGLVAVDGKTLRRSFDAASGKSALHMVSAWSCEERLVLAQIATDEKSNEITAVPQLLRLLDLKGRTVSADAMSCQRDIAQQIVDEGGQYVLSLKGNQPTLFDDVARYLADPEARVLATLKPTVDADHGRIETRSAVVSTDVDWLQDIHHWPGLKAIGAVRRTREPKGERRPADDRDRLLSALRTHHARAAESKCPRPLGRRKPPPLGPRCRHERGPRPQPLRQRSPKPRHSQTPGPQRAQRRALQTPSAPQNEKGRPIRRFPPNPPRNLKCDCPEAA